MYGNAKTYKKLPKKQTTSLARSRRRPKSRSSMKYPSSILSPRTRNKNTRNRQEICKMSALDGPGRAMYEAKIVWAGGSDTRFLRTFTLHTCGSTAGHSRRCLQREWKKNVVKKVLICSDLFLLCSMSHSMTVRSRTTHVTVVINGGR